VIFILVQIGYGLPLVHKIKTQLWRILVTLQIRFATPNEAIGGLF
jgi:hypothetical protein